MAAAEINFDGLVGNTHNYAGLAYGNVASTQNQQSQSQPKAAALQGLKKMQSLMKLGLRQGVLPPQERPHLPSLRAKGFQGTDEAILSQVLKTQPQLLAQCSSAASMWTANAATMSPSVDTMDGKVHLTPANLITNFHRRIETPVTARILKAVFPPGKYFVHHPPLSTESHLGDEGAANHGRMARDHKSSGLEIFVYGKNWADHHAPTPQRYPARQSLEASQIIAQSHQVRDSIFVQQNPAAIDLGVFHNDVIAVCNQNLLFYHEEAFLDADRLVKKIREFLEGAEILHCVPSSALALKDAVQSYLFNSQLLTLPNGKQALISPLECQENPRVAAYLSQSIGKGMGIDEVHFMDVRQSMRNGGGPACLRFRAALQDPEIQAVNAHCLMDDTKIKTLSRWVEKFYRESLTPEDLADPQLLRENRESLDELTQILKLGSVYDFQRSS